jgi:hypothetical protein
MRTLLLSLLLLTPSAFGAMGIYNYSSYTNRTGDSTHLYLTAVVDGSTNCYQASGLCLPAQHHGQVFAQIGSVTRWVYGPNVTPQTYISVQNAVTLTNVVDGVVYTEQTQASVTCTIMNVVFFVTVWADAEIAVTQVMWPGTPPPVAGVYTVLWNCTSDHSPPDYKVGSINSGTVPGATDIRWRAWSPCFRLITLPGGVPLTPWGCSTSVATLFGAAANAQMVATNAPTYPPYACTHKP